MFASKNVLSYALAGAIGALAGIAVVAVAAYAVVEWVERGADGDAW